MNTLVATVLDKSGSMQAIRDATISGFNELLETHQRDNPDSSLKLLKFDTEPREVEWFNPITSAEPLTTKTYVPDGSTALYDAIVKMIRDIEALETQPERVAFIIVTDGMENASRTETRDSVKALIDWHTNEGKGWEFTFLGANIDSYAVGGGMGIRAAAIMDYNATPAGAGAMFATVARSTSSYSGGQAQSVSYTADEKKKVKTTK